MSIISIYINKEQEDFLRGFFGWAVMSRKQKKAYNEIINKLDSATLDKPKKKDGLIFRPAQ